MDHLTTASGKALTIPATFRLEAPVYLFVQRQAEAQGVSMSRFIQQIVLKEVGPKLSPANTGSASGG